MPNSPHLIHLHGPWELVSIDDGNRFSFTRNFSKPTNLDPWEKVFLVFQLDQELIRILLNDQYLTGRIAEGRKVECDITSQLQPRNQLMIQIVLPLDEIRAKKDFVLVPEKFHWGTAGAPSGNLRLEIHD